MWSFTGLSIHIWCVCGWDKLRAAGENCIADVNDRIMGNDLD